MFGLFAVGKLTSRQSGTRIRRKQRMSRGIWWHVHKYTHIDEHHPLPSIHSRIINSCLYKYNYSKIGNTKTHDNKCDKQMLASKRQIKEDYRRDGRCERASTVAVVYFLLSKAICFLVCKRTYSPFCVRVCNKRVAVFHREMTEEANRIWIASEQEGFWCCANTARKENVKWIYRYPGLIAFVLPLERLAFNANQTVYILKKKSYV